MFQRTSATSNLCFFFQAEDGIRDKLVTGVQTCALPISEFDFWDVLWIGLAISAAWRIASKSSWTQHAATVEEEQAASLAEERRRRQEEVRRARGEEPSN